MFYGTNILIDDNNIRKLIFDQMNFFTKKLYKLKIFILLFNKNFEEY